VNTTETSALDYSSFATPNGTFVSKVDQGVATRGYSFGVDFKKDLGDGWGFNGRANFADYHHSFALFSGGDNITNLPTTQSAFLQSYGYNLAKNTSTFTYAASGAAVPASYLLWGDRVTDRDRPLTSETGELNITKEWALGDWTHHLTLGGFFSHTKARDFDYTYSYIGDFDDRPQLVNVTVTNTATGASRPDGGRKLGPGLRRPVRGLDRKCPQGTGGQCPRRYHAGPIPVAGERVLGEWQVSVGRSATECVGACRRCAVQAG
jgi:hypothetical protein